MRLRRRSPVGRAWGLIVLYGAAALLLLWLPMLSVGRMGAVGLLVAYGLLQVRRPQSWWCPECWHETLSSKRDFGR